MRRLRVRILLLPVSPRIDRPALGRGGLFPHVLHLVALTTDPTARDVLQRERVQKGVVSRGRQRAASVPVVHALLLLLAVPSESGGERSTSGGGVHAARDRGTRATAGHRRAGAGGASRLPIDETTREDDERGAARTRARRQRLFDTHRDARLRRDARVAVIYLTRRNSYHSPSIRFDRVATRDVDAPTPRANRSPRARSRDVLARRHASNARRRRRRGRARATPTAWITSRRRAAADRRRARDARDDDDDDDDDDGVDDRARVSGRARRTTRGRDVFER